MLGHAFGRKFTLITDHRRLVQLHSVKDPTSRLVKWKLKLLQYEYEVIHKSGKTNKNADALSRNSVKVCLPLIIRESDKELRKKMPKNTAPLTGTIGQRIRVLRGNQETKRSREEFTSEESTDPE